MHSYEIKPLGGITVESGGFVVVGIPIPSRVRIHKVIVDRTDYAGTGSFTVDLYNLEAAANGTPPIVDANNNPLTADLFHVMPQIAGTNGKAEYWSDQAPGGYAYPFFSQDQAFNGGGNDRFQTNNRTLWVKITATDGWVFCLNLGTDAP